VYGSFVYFIVSPIVDEMVDHSHVSIRGRGNGARGSSSNRRGKDCFGLNTCFGSHRRCNRSDIFDEK
jgi:hypothetical protein